MSCALGMSIGSSRVAEAQQSPVVRGAGSTWSQNAIDQWRADVARFGLRIEYQGTGSTTGRTFFRGGNVDFAVSEIPFQPDEAVTRPFTYMPIVAGGTALMYNLTAGASKITNLRLSPSTIAKIFSCKITHWDDPAIKADNGGADFGHQPIKPVVRSDGSGTTAQFTAFLKAVAPADYTGPVTSFFPYQDPAYACTSGQAQPLSDGVANYVHNESTGSGAITYVETSYAIQRGRPVAALRNASGNYTLPTSANVATALTRAVINPDRTQNLQGVYSHPDPNAYAMSSYSYAIMPTAGFDPAKGNVLGRFIIYFVCDGQRKAEPLGYSPLPPNLQQIAFDAMKEIPGAPPPLTPEQCAREGLSSAAAQNPEGTVPGAGGSTQETAAGSADANPATSGTGDVLDSGLEGSEEALGAPQRVRLAGGSGSGIPLALAGVALLALVLIPPIAAGFAGRGPLARALKPTAVQATASGTAAVPADALAASWSGRSASGASTDASPAQSPLPGLGPDTSLPAPGTVVAEQPSRRALRWPWRKAGKAAPTAGAGVADAEGAAASGGTAAPSIETVSANEGSAEPRLLVEEEPELGGATDGGALDEEDVESRDDPITAEVVTVEDA